MGGVARDVHALTPAQRKPRGTQARAVLTGLARNTRDPASATVLGIAQGIDTCSVAGALSSWTRARTGRARLAGGAGVAAGAAVQDVALDVHAARATGGLSGHRTARGALSPRANEPEGTGLVARTAMAAIAENVDALPTAAHKARLAHALSGLALGARGALQAATSAMVHVREGIRTDAVACELARRADAGAAHAALPCRTGRPASAAVGRARHDIDTSGSTTLLTWRALRRGSIHVDRGRVTARARDGGGSRR